MWMVNYCNIFRFSSIIAVIILDILFGFVDIGEVINQSNMKILLPMVVRWRVHHIWGNLSIDRFRQSLA